MSRHEIEIQIWDKRTGLWEPLSFPKIRYGLESIIIAGTMRILVNNKIVYPTEDRD